MSKFKKFGEFVEAKKAKELDVSDGLAGKGYDGPLAVKPVQEPTKGQTGKPQAYKAAGEEKAGVVWTARDDGAKKGLAFNGSPGITPETTPLGKKVEDKSEPRPAPKKKLTTEQFVAETHGLTNTQFVNYVLESHGDAEITPITDLFGNEFTPDPQQSIQYVAGLLMGNPYYMERFVREIRRRDGLDTLMEEVFTYGNYGMLVEHLEDPDFGEDRTSQLAKALNDKFMKQVDAFEFEPKGDDEKELGESVAPSLDQLMGGLGGPKPPGAGKVQGGAFGGGGADATPDPNYQAGSQFSSDGGQANPMGSAGPGRNPTKGGQPLGGLQNPQFPGAAPVMPPKGMKEGGDDAMPKFKGRSAGIHLINELSNFKHFKRHMRDRCTGPDCP